MKDYNRMYIILIFGFMSNFLLVQASIVENNLRPFRQKIGVYGLPCNRYNGLTTDGHQILGVNLWSKHVPQRKNLSCKSQPFYQKRKYSTYSDIEKINIQEVDFDAIANEEQKIEFLKKYYKDHLDPSLNLVKIIFLTKEASYKDLIFVMQQAKKKAIDQGADKITVPYIHAAIGDIVYGEKKYKNIILARNQGVMKFLPCVEKYVAVHESCHLFVSTILPTGYINLILTVEPRQENLGSLMSIPTQFKEPEGKQELLNIIKVSLAGMVGEQVFKMRAPFKMITEKKDLAYLLSFGCFSGDKMLIQKRADLLMQKYNMTGVDIDNLIMKCYQETYELVTRHKKDVESLIGQVMIKGTLTEDEIYNRPSVEKPMYYYEHGPLPQKLASLYKYRGFADHEYVYDSSGNYVGDKGLFNLDGTMKELD